MGERRRWSDLDEAAVAATRQWVVKLLQHHGCPVRRARELAAAWAFRTDFLLHDWGQTRFDFVVRNPPYVRLEAIPPVVLAEYRSVWRTATDRADLYIPFFECGLGLLSDRGALTFICANRFAKNQYGAALRRLIAERFHVRHYIDLEHTQPFETKVSAYPAIIVLDRECGAPTHAATVEELSQSSNALRRARHRVDGHAFFDTWYPDGAPWVSTSRTRKASMDALAREYPTLEESAPGTRIGIGIATGADEVFVLPALSPDIEASRRSRC